MKELKTWFQALILVIVGVVLLLSFGQNGLANQISVLGITVIIVAVIVATVSYFSKNTIGSRIL